MLTLQAAGHRLCDGLSRRDFLRVGSSAPLGLSLPSLLRASPARISERHFGRAKNCILLFLTGGAPQHETWDPKPDAPAEVRGEGRPIATSVPGIRYGELFPRVARHAEKLCILRSLTHGDTVHTSAGYTMLTGVVHPLANNGSAQNIRPTANDHPHLGALLAQARAGRGPLPVFAALPEVIKDDVVNVYPGQDGGFLSARFDPFRIQADSRRGEFLPPDIALPIDVSAGRLQERRGLSRQLDGTFRALDAQPQLQNLDLFRDQAFDLIRAPALFRAMDLERESSAVRTAYGSHLFAQGCLMARRLVEAGIGLVTVYWHYEGPQESPVWDTHDHHFQYLRERLAPPTDQALAALIADLSCRGLLEDTLVLCMGEFGRTPRINRLAGRDHWPHAQSVLLAGAGVRGGSVFGSSDRLGAFPGSSPVTPADLAATILHLLGVPGDLEVRDRIGRPLLACTGTPIRGMLD